MTVVIHLVTVCNVPAVIEVRCNECTPVYPEIKERFAEFSSALRIFYKRVLGQIMVD
jgi:hypothetical protein